MDKILGDYAGRKLSQKKNNSMFFLCPADDHAVKLVCFMVL